METILPDGTVGETFPARVGAVEVTTATGVTVTYPNVPLEDAIAVENLLDARRMGLPVSDWFSFRNENGRRVFLNLARLIAVSPWLGVIDAATLVPAQPALAAPALPEGETE